MEATVSITNFSFQDSKVTILVQAATSDPGVGADKQRRFFLTVLGAVHLRPGCQGGQVPLRALFLVQTTVFLLCPYMTKRQRELSL